jgi:hypothetical protein
MIELALSVLAFLFLIYVAYWAFILIIAGTGATNNYIKTDRLRHKNAREAWKQARRNGLSRKEAGEIWKKVSSS